MSGTSTVSSLLLVACASLAVTAGPAAAHTGLVDTEPTDGATVQQAPEQLRLRFHEPVDPELVTVVVTGPDGRAGASGPPAVTGAEVVQPLVHGVGAGNYRVVFRVVSTDGHPVQGQLRFVVAAPAQVAPVPLPATTRVVAAVSAPAATGDLGGEGGAPLAAAAASGAVGGGAAALVRRRQRITGARGAGRA